MNINSFYDEPDDAEEQQSIIFDEEEKKFGLFDIINDISNKTNVLYELVSLDQELPKEYNQFMINKAFGHYLDTVLLANEMNMVSVPDIAHFLYMYGATSKKRRFAKWYNPVEPDFIPELAAYFGCTEREMKMNLHNVPGELINELKEKFTKIKSNDCVQPKSIGKQPTRRKSKK